MKKFIAAMLSVLVGAFGYTIVDSTIENRVSSLENEVYDLKQEVSRYHNIIDSSNTNNPNSNTTDPTYKDTQSGINDEDLIDENGVEDLGYKYDNSGYYYIDDKECWVKDSEYNEVYDNMTPLTAMFIDQVRIKFNYGGKDWMIQFWKGQYGWLLVGNEIGLYTAEEGVNSGDVTYINHYYCADKSDWLKMSTELYWAEGNNGDYKLVATRPYDSYWWATSFVKGQLTKFTWPRTELKARYRITFKDTDMANAFIEALKNAGFAMSEGNSPDTLTDDTYYQNGADVWILWSSIYHDCFK